MSTVQGRNRRGGGGGGLRRVFIYFRVQVHTCFQVAEFLDHNMQQCHLRSLKMTVIQPVYHLVSFLKRRTQCGLVSSGLVIRNYDLFPTGSLTILVQQTMVLLVMATWRGATWRPGAYTLSSCYLLYLVRSIQNGVTQVAFKSHSIVFVQHKFLYDFQTQTQLTQNQLRKKTTTEYLYLFLYRIPN